VVRAELIHSTRISRSGSGRKWQEQCFIIKMTSEQELATFSL
jgi:hypothetical protein